MSEFAAFAAQIDQLRQAAGIAGAAVAVVRDAQVVYVGAFGHQDNDPLTIETPFEVASLSKPLFAYAVMKLCEQAVLDLDTPISDYLPTPYVPDEPYLALMTVRHALSHTTGFPNWREASGLRAAFPPGSAFNYSTEGLIYLQTAVEYVIRQPFHEYAREAIFQPFGMEQSEYLPADMESLPDYLPRHLYSIGAVSLKTTAPDYARFVTEFMREGAGDSFRLGEAAVAEMLTSHIQVGEQEGLFWGLGWGIEHSADHQDFWHWGMRRSRTRNFAIGSREHQTGVVILTNHVNGLTICEPIVQMMMPRSAHPAFTWLLPPEGWRGDGRKAAAHPVK